MLFSLRRKAPKDSPRRCLGLLSICWEVHTHGSQQTEPRTYVRSPSFAVREVYATGKLALAGARRAPCERLPIRYLLKRRRLTDHASLASVDAVFYSRHRTAASRTNGQAVRLRLLFVLFFAERKEHVFLLFKGEGYVSISTKKLPFHRKRELFLILTLRRRGTVFALFRRSPETLYRSFR